jgi:predicted DNA-binding antitoxin AbrB/MazE fold protein
LGVHWFPSGVSVIAITVEAIYENGVLRLAEPLPWKDSERVRIAISSLDSPLLKAYGIMGFQGTAEEAEYFALHPDLLPEEGR